MTYTPLAGSSITVAAHEATELAIANQCIVSMSFNGINLEASPTKTVEQLLEDWQTIRDAQSKAYHESPEGIAARAKREADITLHQEGLTTALQKLPSILEGGNIDDLIFWLAALIEHSDHMGTDWDKASGQPNGRVWVIAQLTAAGYVENDGCGKPKEHFKTRLNMGRYIVGQAINCLNQCMGPHPVTVRFCADYFKLPACPQSEDTRGGSRYDRPVPVACHGN